MEDTSIWTYLIIVATSTIGGWIGGQVGGGALLPVPAFIALGYAPIEVIAGTAFSGFFLNLFSARKKLQHTSIEWKRLLPVFVISALGVVLGSLVSPHIPKEELKLGIALLLLFLLALSFRKQKDANMPPRPFSTGFYVLMFFLGCYGGAVVMSFTSFAIMAFVMRGRPLEKAIPISFILTCVVTFVGTLSYAFQNLILWDFALVYAIGFSLGGHWGAAFSNKQKSTWLKKLFSIVVFIAAMKLLYDVFFPVFFS